MKKVLMLFCLFAIGKAGHAQILGGGGSTLTLTDNEGHNVAISACSSMQCNNHTFTAPVSSYPYPALSTPYTFLDITWTPAGGGVYHFNVTLADVDSSPGGIKTYTITPARLVITKQGASNYSFILETNDGSH